MQPKIQAEELAQSIACNLCETKEYLCLSNYLIVASEVSSESEDLDECTVCIVHQVYGRKNSSDLYAICLFNSYYKPTVGFISNSSLQLFQDLPLGRLRLSYLPQPQDLGVAASNSSAIPDSIDYHFWADISTDGNDWKPFISGIYK